SFEGRPERPGGEAPDLDRTGGAPEPVAGRRAIAVRIARVAAVFDAKQVREALFRAPVVQREPSGGLERDLDPMVEEGAPLYQRALGRRPGTAGRGRTDRQTRAGQPQPWHARRAERDAHLVHLVLVRVVVRRVEPLRPDASVE